MGKDVKTPSTEYTMTLREACGLLKQQDKELTALHNAKPSTASQLSPCLAGNILHTKSNPSQKLHTYAQDQLQELKNSHLFQKAQLGSQKPSTQQQQQGLHALPQEPGPEQAKCDKPATMLAVMPHMWASFNANMAADELFASRKFRKSDLCPKNPEPHTQ